jgi:hypothetical protein
MARIEMALVDPHPEASKTDIARRSIRKITQVENDRSIWI